jgi:hypothetical protein
VQLAQLKAHQQFIVSRVRRVAAKQGLPRVRRPVAHVEWNL